MKKIRVSFESNVARCVARLESAHTAYVKNLTELASAFAEEHKGDQIRTRALEAAATLLRERELDRARGFLIAVAEASDDVVRTLVDRLEADLRSAGVVRAGGTPAEAPPSPTP